MFQRKPRRYRRRPNGRDHLSRVNSDGHTRHSFSNGHMRNSFRNNQSAEKLFEKYKTLAKEALSSGDKTLSENYYQHADHFMRIIEDKNKNQNLDKTQTINKPTSKENSLTENNEEKKVSSINEKKE